MPLFSALPKLRAVTVGVLVWLGLVLAAENFVGHIGDFFVLRGWPLVWHRDTTNAPEIFNLFFLLLNMAACGWVLWSTARLTNFVAYERWRFSLGSLLLLMAAAALALGVVRAGAPDDTATAIQPLRVLEPAHPWGFVWSRPGVRWCVNAALLLGLLAGCWNALRLAADLGRRAIGTRLHPAGDSAREMA